MKRFKHKLLCEALDDRIVPAGITLADIDHLEGSLQRLLANDDRRGMQVDSLEHVAVSVTANDAAAAARALDGLGYKASTILPERHLTEGWLPVAALPAAEALGDAGFLRGVTAVQPGSPGAGNVTSEAVHVLRSAFVNAKASGAYTGAGITVGVISDSYGLRTTVPVNGSFLGPAADISTNDLPAGSYALIEGPSGSVATDEGRAMMQLVYDIAPGCKVVFAKAGSMESETAASVVALVAAGVNIIVDDWQDSNGPLFQEGLVGQSYKTAVDKGFICVSISGNFGSRGFMAYSFPTANDTFAPGSKFFDFTGGGVTRNTVTVPAGAQLRVQMHWDDPYYTGPNNGVDSDLALVFTRSGNNTILTNIDSNNVATGVPREFQVWTNTSPNPVQVDMLVQVKPDTVVPGRLHLDIAGVPVANITYANGPTIFGHNASQNAITVAGSVYSDQRQSYASNSRGGTCVHVFDAAGNAVAPSFFTKPDVTGVTGINTTFFGGSDDDGDGKLNFYGTSAAAPHVAGVVALMYEQAKATNTTITPAGVRNVLTATARDIAAPGWDVFTAQGMVDAFTAVYGAQTTVSVAALDPIADGFENGLGTSWVTYADVNGRVRITSAFAAATGSKALVLDSFYTTTGTKSTTYAEVQFNGQIPDLKFTFQAKNLGSETAPVNRVYLYGEAGKYTQLLQLDGEPNAWTPHTFDLHDCAAKAGFVLGGSSRIRFHHWDDSSASGPSDYDGFAVDNVEITTEADAPTHTFTGLANSDWHNAFNWSAFTVPSAASAVRIPASLTVDVAANAAAKTICSYGNLNFNGGYSTIASRFDSFGPVTVTNTHLDFNANWNSRGNTTFKSGILENGNLNTGKIVVAANTEFNMFTPGGRYFRGMTIENYGKGQWTDGAIYGGYAYEGAGWINKPGSSFYIANNDDHWLLEGGTVSCTAFTVEPGATRKRASNGQRNAGMTVESPTCGGCPGRPNGR